MFDEVLDERTIISVDGDPADFDALGQVEIKKATGVLQLLNLAAKEYQREVAALQADNRRLHEELARSKSHESNARHASNEARNSDLSFTNTYSATSAQQAAPESEAADEDDERGDHASRQFHSLKSATSTASSDQCEQLLEPEDGVDENDESGATTRCIGGVLNPDWMGRLAWDFGVIALVLVDAMVLPFGIAFKHGKDPDAFDIAWLWITTIFFVTDIICNFFTGYVAGPKEKDVPPGKLVTKKIKIARHYLRSWFPIDFVSTIPWSVLADTVSSGDDGGGGGAQMAKLTKVVKFVRFLRLIRMLRLAKLGVIWDRIEAKMGSIILLQIITFVRLLFVVVAICHWHGCIWWVIGQPLSIVTEMMDDSSQFAWVNRTDHWTTIRRQIGTEGETWRWIDKPTFECYIFCFYWCLGVMRTMPTEVQPVNLAERMYVMLFMIFAVAAFAITVTYITQAFMKIFERKRVFTDDMAQVRIALRGIHASDSLQGKVRSYLRHQFDRRRINAKEDGLFKNLPNQLKHVLHYSKTANGLQKLPSLANFSSKLLFRVSLLANVQDLMPGHRISVAGRVAKAAWVLMVGRLSKQDEYGVDVKTDSPIEVVDEECLSQKTAIVSISTVATVSCCEMLTIDGKKFREHFSDLGDHSRRPQSALTASQRAQVTSHRPSTERQNATAAIMS
jgi:hypothetical protein